MKKLIAICAVAALAACGSPETAEEDVAIADTEAQAEVMSLHETSWTFTRDDKDILESIDADGNYIANAGDEHYDHGTYALVDGQQCFTSAMNDEGQVCWSAPAAIAVGESSEITNNEGETLTVTRTEYQPLTM